MENGIEKYTLAKPIQYDGETITELVLDLESLSVKDLERAEKEARSMLAKKESMNVPETNKKYQACVAAKAAGVTIDLIRSLSGKDYTQVCLLVMNFLLDGGSDMEEEVDEPEVKSGKTASSRKTTDTPTLTASQTALNSSTSQ